MYLPPWVNSSKVRSASVCPPVTSRSRADARAPVPFTPIGLPPGIRISSMDRPAPLLLCTRIPVGLSATTPRASHPLPRTHRPATPPSVASYRQMKARYTAPRETRGGLLHFFPRFRYIRTFFVCLPTATMSILPSPCKSAHARSSTPTPPSSSSCRCQRLPSPSSAL
jgi:hypothetical protein